MPEVEQVQTSSAERSSPYVAAKPDRLNGLPPPKEPTNSYTALIFLSCEIAFGSPFRSIHSGKGVNKYDRYFFRWGSMNEYVAIFSFGGEA